MTNSGDKPGGAIFKGPSYIEFSTEVDQNNWEYFISLVTSARASFTRHINNPISSLEEPLKTDKSIALKQ